MPPILNLNVYINIEKRRKAKREQEKSPEKPASKEDNLLAECEHIHNKALFDCINESLVQFKPYAKDGEPMPWSKQNRKVRMKEDYETEEMFELVKHDCFRWAIM